MRKIAKMLPILPKKLKVDPTNATKDSTALFTGGTIGSRSELGKYVSELGKNPDGEPQKSFSHEVVDLSNDDDQDLVYLGSSGDKEVCLGRVEGATINAHTIPAPKPGTWTRTDTLWPVITLNIARLEGLRMQAKDASDTRFGLLDPKTAHALVPILNASVTNPIRLSARLLARPRKAGEFPGSVISAAIALDLTLYAPKSRAKDIGKHLSQNSVWLRRPTQIDKAGIEYFNPQDVHVAEKRLAVQKNAARSGYVSRTVEEIRSDLQNMFDTIGRWTDLKEQEPDSRITTPLLSHQKQGLYFIYEREKDNQGQDIDEKSLWKKDFMDNGSQFFYHVITGTRVDKRPTPTRGGILADDMGLGKTLTLLSAVVGTASEAAAFAKLSPRGPNRQAMLVRNSRATLIVCPLSVIQNWEEQISSHIAKSAFKYHVYHGPNRIKDLRRLALDYDLVITSYGTVRAEYAKINTKCKPIEQLNWFRVCLDESHAIRDIRTTQSLAICAISAQRRWAVTGTPIQNRLDDLGALLKFLQVAELDNTRQFNQHIIAPFKTGDTEVLAKLRLLVDHITLRRDKRNLDLPPRVDQRVVLDFTPEEEGIYISYAKLAKARANAYISGRMSDSVAGTGYIQVLKLITVLRLLCAHGIDLLSEDDKRLVKGSSTRMPIDLETEDYDEDGGSRPALKVNEAYGVLREMRLNDAYECDRCKQSLGESSDVDDEYPKSDIIGYMLPCYSVICAACIEEFQAEITPMVENKHLRCPYCLQRTRFEFFDLKQTDVDAIESARARVSNNPRRQRMLDEYAGPHTKTKALLDALLDNEQESAKAPDEPPIKSVVFSTWTSHLDLIEVALRNAGLGDKFTRLDGSMPLKKRSQCLSAFRDDKNITIILISITAGGLGLNLTAASRVYVMEPLFNPAAEAQAIDRVYRLGQTREVQVTRFIMNGSVEERILKIQEMKIKLADLSLNRHLKLTKDQDKRRKLDELRELFK